MAALTVKAHMVTDLFAKPSSAFVGHPPSSGARGETTRLQQNNATIVR
jgi:hypothetical protein